jgi:hypothetical protein
MNTTIEKLIAGAKKVNGPDDYKSAALATISVMAMATLLVLSFWKYTDAEALAFVQFFWPWATHNKFLLPLMVVQVVYVFTPLVIVWQLMKHHDRHCQGKLGRQLVEALAAPNFINTFNATLEEVVERRVTRVRPYEHREGRAILAPAFKDFLPDIVPAETVDEGSLAHLYRSLNEEARIQLRAVCPKIVEMRIGVVQASPLDAFSTQEVR